MDISVKICGLTNKESVTAASENGANYVGFVFYKKSPRNIDPKLAKQLISSLDENIKTVAVMVSPENLEIENIFNIFKPNYLQLHGNESRERVLDIKKKFDIKIIKAISIGSSQDLKQISFYNDIVDMLLFDTKIKDSYLPGGNGITFDWDLLKKENFTIPWFLSGGINIENVIKALEDTQAKMIDISSGLESKLAIKDTDKIKKFLNKVKNHDKTT